MTEKPLPINEVVAENLGYLMRQAGMTQAALAEKAGVSQKTISNYLNPAQRSDNTSGKQPSPKLVELDQIATALDVRVWELTRQMTPQERRMYEAIEKAYRELRDTVEKGGASDIHQPALPGSKDEQGNSAYSDEAGSAGKNGLSVVKRASGRPLPPALDREDAIHRGDGNYDDEGSTDRAAPKPAKNPRGRR